MKIKGPKIISHALINGKEKHDELDISKGFKDRMLFEAARSSLVAMVAYAVETLRMPNPWLHYRITS